MLPVSDSVSVLMSRARQLSAVFAGLMLSLILSRAVLAMQNYHMAYYMPAQTCIQILISSSRGRALLFAGSKVKDLSPSLLATLLKDRHKVAQLLVQLREYLPHANVSQMVSRKHALLTQVSSPPQCGT